MTDYLCVLPNESGKLLLRINPTDQICFKTIGKDYIATSEICNIADTMVAYKIKTTSPSKFRVHPSMGTLPVGGSKTINITALHEFDKKALCLEKFLILSMSVDPNEINGKDVTSLWKNITNDNPLVEQHRLKSTIACPKKPNEPTKTVIVDDPAANKSDDDTSASTLRHRGRNNQQFYDANRQYVINGQMVLQFIETSERIEYKQNQIKHAMIFMWIVILTIVIAIIYIYSLIDVKNITK